MSDMPHAYVCRCGAPGTIHDPCNRQEILDGWVNLPEIPDSSGLPTDDAICLHTWADQCDCWTPATFTDATGEYTFRAARGDLIEHRIDGIDPVPMRVTDLVWETWRFSDKPKLRIVAEGYGHERSWSLHPDQPENWPTIPTHEPDTTEEER